VVVLLFGSPRSHEGRIADRLKARGVEAAVFDTTELPLHPVSLELRGDHLRGELDTTIGRLDIDRVTGFWMGAPLPVIHTPKMDFVSEVFAIEEWSSFYENLFAMTSHKPWVNPRDAARRSEAKLLQAREAAKLGIATPEAIVTSDPPRVPPFLQEHHDELAIKTLNHRSVTFRLGSVDWVLWTNRITPEDANLQKLEYLRVSPAFLQEYVRKKTEARAWVVGDRVFAAEIFSQDDPQTVVDWRRYPTKETPEGLVYDKDRWRCAPLDLPSDFAEKLVTLRKRLGLAYTAVDLVRREDGQWVFLEANDGGAYLWVEKATGLPISDALAEMLASMVSSTPGRG